MRFNLKMVSWIGFLLATGLFLGGADGSGCGDDSTKEAKLEKAKIALDKGNFSEAVETLQELCGTNLSAPTCDQETVSLYASAYAGRAGLDVLDLIKEAVDQPVNQSSSFTLFSKHFAVPDPTGEKVIDIGNAVSLLASITSRTQDQGLKFAVVSTVDLVIFLGSLTNGYDTTTGKPNAIPSVSAITAGNLSRVLADTNDMDTGLTEANIGDENISGHIGKIKDSLSGSPAGIVTFLSNI